jgi:FixJ family two-component response regulator
VSQKSLIAIVDDNPSVRDSLKRLVKSSGYNAESFASVHGFLTSGKLEDIGCIIADVQMPKATGFDMQRMLKSAGYCIPILFITAFPSDKGRDEALKAGAYCYLHKPVSVGELFDCVRSALSQKTD